MISSSFFANSFLFRGLFLTCRKLITILNYTINCNKTSSQRLQVTKLVLCEYWIVSTELLTSQQKTWEHINKKKVEYTYHYFDLCHIAGFHVISRYAFQNIAVRQHTSSASLFIVSEVWVRVVKTSSPRKTVNWGAIIKTRNWYLFPAITPKMDHNRHGKRIQQELAIRNYIYISCKLQLRSIQKRKETTIRG